MDDEVVKLYIDYIIELVDNIISKYNVKYDKPYFDGYWINIDLFSEMPIEMKELIITQFKDIDWEFIEDEENYGITHYYYLRYKKDIRIESKKFLRDKYLNELI